MSKIDSGKIPTEVTHVTETLQNAGFEAYLVGGCVRDLLLGFEPKDWDVTTNAHPNSIQELFEETYYNNPYGTVGVVMNTATDPRHKVIEVTPYRTEHGYSDSRRPDRVEFSQHLEEDLGRRDFTVNALAYNVLEDIIIDLYKGQEDIVAKRLVTVGDPDERFSEDALRMIRAIRLSAELGFSISLETFTSIGNNVGRLANISRERTRDEFSKILLSKTPSQALFHMKQVRMLQYVIPDMERTFDVEQNRSHIYTVYEHLVRSLQHAADKGFPLEIRIAALFHDISKPESRRYDRDLGDYTFYGHEVIGSLVTRRALTELKYPKEIIEKVVLLVRWHMFFSDPDEISLSAVRRMIANVGKENIWDLVNVRVCDRIGSGKPKEQPLRLRKYKSMIEQAMRDPISVSMLKIDGSSLISELHMKPGPEIGWILHALLEEVLEDPAKNTQQYLFSRSSELVLLPRSELKLLGEKGRVRKEEVDEQAINEIRRKHNVL